MLKLPLSEFQIGCVVNNCRGFTIQCLPFQAKAIQEMQLRRDKIKNKFFADIANRQIKITCPHLNVVVVAHLKSIAPRPIRSPVRTEASSLKTMAPSA